jgi:molybdate transport system ATP-binding protein
MIDVRIRKRLSAFELDATFSAPPRGVTAMFGRSGSGKTSILNAMAGALTPDEGRIALGPTVFFDSVQGIDIPIHRRRVGFVFQDARLFPHLSVRSNLLYGDARWSGPKARSLDDVVDLLDIAPLLQRRIHHLSGGEKQRVAIGRALLAHPDLLLMDEPLASLDQNLKADLLPYIEGLRDAFALPIIYISHAFDEVVRLANHLVVLDQGRVERQGDVIALAADPTLSPYLGRFEAGAVVDCDVHAHDDRLALSTLGFTGGTLRVPRVASAVGTRLRVRIRARDVAIALSEPRDLSISNSLPGQMVSLLAQGGPHLDVVLDIGGTALRARITRDSAERLKLQVGLSVWALIKTAAFDGPSLGFRRRPPDASLADAPGTDASMDPTDTTSPPPT